MKSKFLEVLEHRVIVLDGAMGTSIQGRKPCAHDFGGDSLEGLNDHLVLSKPSMIEEVHASFLEVGCDALETNTFGGNRLKLDEYGIGEKVYEVNFAAAALARRVADRFATPDRPRFVVGSMGPTGMLPSSTDPHLSNITFDQLREIFREQAAPLVEGGADALMIETCQDILEVKAAVIGCREYFVASGNRVPLIVSVSLDTQGKMLLGTDIASVLATLEPLRIDVLGMNCSTGPDYMKDPVRYLSQHSPMPISVVPNAGLPINEGGCAVYPMSPGAMAAVMAEFVRDYGVQIVGGCCGTTPAHLKAVIDALRDIKPARREPRYARSYPLYASSGMAAVSLVQDQTIMMIGERCNAQGSKAVKDLLLADKYDDLQEIAREQAEFGAHALDVCVAMTERTDEDAQMREVVRRLSNWVALPLVIDSTEPHVIEAALKCYPGSAIVNSINMEEGRQRIDAVMPLVMRYGASVIALTIDKAIGGMAKTADDKIAVARKIHDLCVNEFGLDARRLLFDCLTFTLATGQDEFRDSAVQTIEAIRRVKRELPGVLTTLGLSNVSFGFKPNQRRVLNSVFLYHAWKAGLDTAIVNPRHILPYADIPAEPRQLAEDLVFDASPEALAKFITFFDANKGVGAESGNEKVDPTEGMTAEEAVHWKIVHRKADKIEGLLDEVMTRITPVQTLNQVLLPAMKEVGDKFGSGELILPFVLQSAEVMKRAVAHVEQFLERKEGVSKGILVLATVYGDVHDIGKNLVRTIIGNNGFTVHDLGKQVPVNTIVEAARAKKADAVGLSALLVSTSAQMPIVVKELHKAGLNIPVIIGGAAINRGFGRRTNYIDKDVLYEPGVFYSKDAFEGLDVIEQLVDPAQRVALMQRHREELRRSAEIAAQAAVGATNGKSKATRSTTRVLKADEMPQAPFLGVKTLEEIPLAEVLACMDLNTLFRLHWGGKNKTGADWEKLLREEFQPRLRDLSAEAEREGYLDLRAVVGLFRCRAEGNDVVLLDPEDSTRAIERFSFPRQQGRDNLCLADYYAPGDAPEVGGHDIIAIQCVTVGDRASVVGAEWDKAGDYARSYFLHGLAMEAAEGLAEYTHRYLIKRMGLRPGRGKRYSWGYPAIPDLSDHTKVFKLLGVTERIGLELTEAYQLVPEQSTAAVIVHHPDATYYQV